MKRLLQGLCGVALVSLGSDVAYAQKVALGEVMVLNAPDLKAGVDTAAFEEYVLTHFIPAWNTTAPGVQLSLLRADRGRQKGEYLFVSTIDKVERHERSGSAGGMWPFPPPFREVVDRFRSGLEQFIDDETPYDEYRLLGASAAGPLPEVEILGIHDVKVLPDRREAFETFVAAKLHPAVANLRPDLRLLYYKSARAREAGQYLLIFALTTDSRDKYWPGGSDSDDLRAAFKPLGALAEELRTYFVPGSYVTGEKFAAAIFESREWTDFVRVSKMTR